MASSPRRNPEPLFALRLSCFRALALPSANPVPPLPPPILASRPHCHCWPVPSVFSRRDLTPALTLTPSPPVLRKCSLTLDPSSNPDLCHIPPPPSNTSRPHPPTPLAILMLNANLLETHHSGLPFSGSAFLSQSPTHPKVLSSPRPAHPKHPTSVPLSFKTHHQSR